MKRSNVPALPLRPSPARQEGPPQAEMYGRAAPWTEEDEARAQAHTAHARALAATYRTHEQFTAGMKLETTAISPRGFGPGWGF